MDSTTVIHIVVLFFLLILGALFSSAEIAMTKVSALRMRTLADNGDKKAALVLHVIEHKTQKMLSTVLIGGNIVNIVASAITTSLAIHLLGGIWVGIMTASITVIIIIFCEITPKSAAVIDAEKLSLRYIRMIQILMTILTPIIFILNGISSGILRMMHIDPNVKINAITEDELRTLVDVIHEDGVIESEEKEMINNVFDLGDAKAKDVMVPRVNISFASANSSYWDLIEIYRRDHYTRLPVYEENTDNVIGTVNMKDLLLYEDRDHFHLRNILREPYFTYEYKNISELLVEMREDSINIAIVLDEYGDTAGIITLEDILEEIVGEIRDEYDESELELFKKINEHEYLVEGSVNLDDVNDTLDTELESEEFDSLGGIIIEQLDRLPEVGDEVTLDTGVRLVVEKTEKNRVALVHVYLLDPEEKLIAMDELELE